MTGAGLISLAPLAMVALAAVAAMAMAPLAPHRAIRGVTAALMAGALGLVAARFGAAEARATALLADDGIARFGAGLALASGLGVLGFGRQAAREGPALVALATAGAMALAAADHAATLFLGLEVTTLALIGATILPRSGLAVEAGYKLFLIAGAGAAALLMGAAYGLAESGSLRLSACSGGGALAAIGAGLVLAGLAVKFALVPFHMWAPDMFEGAPPPAAAIAGAVSKVAVGAALLRLTIEAPGGPVWTAGLAVTGTAAVILGNLAALRQESLTRMLGYSSVAQSGYMALMLATGQPLSREGVLVFLAAYAPAVVAALCVAAWAGTGGIAGLVWRRPLAGVSLALALLSMTGLPPTSGFVGKIYLFSALAGAGAWVLLAAAAAGSALAFVFYIRFALRTVAAAPDLPEPPPLPWPAALTLAACLLLMIVPGVWPEPLLSLARAALP